VAATKAALPKRPAGGWRPKTNIVPVIVADPKLCKQAKATFGLSGTGILHPADNYPTVVGGTERCGSPTPAHGRSDDYKMLADASGFGWQETRFSRSE